MVLLSSDIGRVHSRESLFTMIRIMSKTASGFNICHINAQSLHRKIDEFRYIFEESEMDIICISETWFRIDINDDIYRLRGYRLFRSDRVSNAGGVAIYVRSSISCRVVCLNEIVANDETNNETATTIYGERTENSQSVESLFLEFFSSTQKLLLGAIYRPNNRINIKPLLDKLSLFTLGYTDVVLIGDFNANILQNRSMAEDMSAIGMHLVNNSIPTHYTSSTSTLIDLCFTTNPNQILLFDQLSASAFSKHDLLFLSYNFQTTTQEHAIMYRDFRNIDFASLEMESMSIPWNHTYLMPSVDEQVAFLHGNIQYLFEKYVRIKTKTLRNDKPWFTNEIRTLINVRNNAYCRWKRFRTTDLYNYFKACRNEVNLRIRSAKLKFYEEKFQSAVCTKRKWKDIHSMGIVNRNVATNNTVDVNQLSIEFSNIPKTDADLEYYNSIDVFAASNLIAYSNFEFKNVTQEDVIKCVYGIKSNSFGCDEIHPIFIKLILPYIIASLTHLMNTIITTSTFPTMWKCAKVIPVPKQDRSFRPIAILPYLSKVLEKLINKQITQYLNENELLSERQSGFRPNHSCVTALMDVSEELRSKADNNMISFLVLLDYSKAFDTVDHTILCQKLKHMCNFSDTAIKLMSSYLSNRSQFVYHGCNKSNISAISRGVPQGSILGPLLYTIYSNDLQSKLKFCNIQMYADDVQLYISCLPSDTTNCISKLNHDLENIFKWASTNGLCLNPKKTKALIIGKVNSMPSFPPIKLKNTTIETVHNVKNLGITFNNNLNWSNHVNIVCGRTLGMLRNLWLTQYFTPINIRMLLAKTYLIPTLLYGCELFSSCDSVSRNRLKITYNNIARYVYGRTRYSRISEYSYNIYKISFENLLKCRSLIYLHKLIYTKQPQYLYRRLTFSRSNRGLKVNCIRYRKHISNQHFYIYAIRLWNELPNNIQMLSNAKQFKTAIFTLLNNNNAQIN